MWFYFSLLCQFSQPIEPVSLDRDKGQKKSFSWCTSDVSPTICIASKTIFLAYIRLLAILGGSQRGSDKAEALEEVFGCLDAHSQTEVEESLTWKYVDHATDLAQLKWSSVGEVQECHRQNLVVLPQAICSEVHLEVKGVLQ